MQLTWGKPHYFEILREWFEGVGDVREWNEGVGDGLEDDRFPGEELAYESLGGMGSYF